MEQTPYVILVANDSTFCYHLRREILQAMVHAGCRVSVICQVLDFRQELEVLSCRVIPINARRRRRNPMEDGVLLWSLLRILRREHPDVVFTNNIKPNVYAGLACRMLGIRYIPNITGLGTPLVQGGRLGKLTRWLYRIGIRGADTVLFQNEDNLDFFRRNRLLGEKSRILLLPGSGVNLEAYPCFPYPAEGTVHFLYAARVMREKGIDQFLAAAREITARHPDTVFHVCGGCDDEGYQSILADAQRQGLIRYHGLQRELLPFYRDCSCFLYPSYYPEGMSNVLLEAAACGRPVIAADCPGCREPVEDGVTGYLVPTRDTAAVIEAAERFLALSPAQRARMGQAGREKMEREFDRQMVAAQYLRLIGQGKSTSSGGTV